IVSSHEWVTRSPAGAKAPELFPRPGFSLALQEGRAEPVESLPLRPGDWAGVKCVVYEARGYRARQVRDEGPPGEDQRPVVRPPSLPAQAEVTPHVVQATGSHRLPLLRVGRKRRVGGLVQEPVH